MHPMPFLLFMIWVVCSSCMHDVMSQVPGQVHRTQLEAGVLIDIYTPPEYSERRDYPLLLLHDGEVIFDKNNWNLASVLDDLIVRKRIEPIIAVAIHHQGKRNDWYIPYEDPWIRRNWGSYTPSSDEYARLILQDVIPYLESEYHITKGRTGVMGFSLGGLISTWLGVHFSDEFKYSASLSGSYWVSDHQLFNEAKAGPIENSGQIYWFDIGTDEWNYYVPLYKILDDQGFEAGEQSYYYEVPGGQHSSPYWLNRLQIPLTLFYGTEKNSEPQSMDVHLQCIPSQSVPGRKFRRLNPVVSLQHGIKYSLAHKATYTVTVGDIQLGSEGSFSNNPEIDSEVLVEYGALSSRVAIPQGWCR